MVKLLQKSSSPERAGGFPSNFICSIDNSCPSYFVQMVTWNDLDLFYGNVKFGNLDSSIGKWKNSGSFKTIAACDLKLIELMKISEN